MKLQNKYIKCFTKEKFECLKEAGYTFLYEQNGVYYFESQNAIKFNNSDLLKDTKFSTTVNF